MLDQQGVSRRQRRPSEESPRWIAFLLASSLAVGACAGSESGMGEASGQSAGATLVFAPNRETRSLDPAVGTGIIELQFASLLFDTLVRMRPGTTEVEPSLATAWRRSDDGTSLTFTLREDVRFHDGTTFDAAAVCANFQRWHGFRGVLQSPALTNHWQNVFGGFASRDDPAAPAESLYRSCDAPSTNEVALNLNRPSGLVLSALALPAFSIASPQALQRYGADRVGGSGNEPRFEGTFATEHPVGTGPFKFEHWARQERVTLVRNEDYWGPAPKLARIILPAIPEPSARRLALESGEIDGYDVVSPGDIPLLERQGFTIVRRPAFNVGTIAMNRARAPLDKLEVRKAVAHAIDRETLVAAKYPPGTEVANQFVPPSLWGRAAAVEAYRHDPDEARRLLASIGEPHPAVEIWYRPEYRGPIVADGAGVVQAMKADLERVGFRVEVKAASHADYLKAGFEGRLHMWIDESLGGWGDPDSFVRPYKEHAEVFGIKGHAVLALVDRAASEADQTRRAALYGQLNRELVADLPAVPFVHVPIYLAVSRDVSPIVAGPLPWDYSFMRSVRK